MALRVDDRVLHRGMRIVVLGQRNDGAQVDRLAPPLAEDLTLDLDALDRIGVRRHLHRRVDPVGGQPNRGRRRRVEVNLHGIAVEIAGRRLPVLAFPLIHVEPHRVAVGAGESRVHVDERLCPVVASRQVLQALDGMAEGRGVDRRDCARREVRDRDRKERHAGRVRLRNRGLTPAWRRPAEGDVHAARHRLGAGRGGERDLNYWTGCRHEAVRDDGGSGEENGHEQGRR